MGYYVNPVERVANIGRKLLRGDFNSLQAQLHEGEGIVGIGDRLVFKFAILLYCESEYHEMNNQYTNGMLVSFDFYAVPLTEFPDYIP